MRVCLRRREFIAGLGGAAAAWPLAARAQQGMRRIGVLVPGDEDDPVRRTLVSAFTQALADLGWADGRNVRIDLRWAPDDTNRIRALAQVLVGLQPDIILASTTPATVALQRETDDPDRLCDRGRSRRQWPRRRAQPPGREHHWLHPIGGLICRQVA